MVFPFSIQSKDFKGNCPILKNLLNNGPISVQNWNFAYLLYPYKNFLILEDNGAVKTIVILSSFSSGSTALAGFLERCGAHTCPPHMITSDKRTPLSYENIF